MNPFNTALLKAPQRSRFDFNHSNTIGLKFGALTPTLSQFIIPGDDVSISMEQIIRNAPMPVPTFVDLKVRHDFFFVPLRLLYGSEYLDQLFGSDTSTISRACVPNLVGVMNAFSSFGIEIDSSSNTVTTNHVVGAPFVAGELLDYLGYPVFSDRNSGLNATNITALQSSLSSFASSYNATGTSQLYQNANDTGAINIEKIFAYHYIWRDWYRFTGIQDNSIVEPYLNNGILSKWSSDGSGSLSPAVSTADTYFGLVSRLSPYCNGNLRLGELSYLKYAHLTKDMFTSVRYGNKPTVLIPSGSSGTIPALREASALQRFLDIISITGQRYFDKVKGLFGVEPVGPKDDRVQFLGRYQQFIKVGEVLTTANSYDSSGNALSVTGDYAGRGILIDGKYIFKRHFTEHGWLFCISSVIPNVAYSGLSRDLTDVYPIDSPLPSLAQIGDQSVLMREMFFRYTFSGNNNNSSLGDQFRYYAYKSAPDEVHGFFKMSTAQPWSPLINFQPSGSNIIALSRVLPQNWNYVFNDTANEYLYGDRFFMKLDFYESITRCLPKYINYHL